MEDVELCETEGPEPLLTDCEQGENLAGSSCPRVEGPEPLPSASLTPSPKVEGPELLALI